MFDHRIEFVKFIFYELKKMAIMQTAVKRSVVFINQKNYMRQIFSICGRSFL